MSDPSSYVIRGGIPGRERLRVLSRIVHESTARLLDRVGFSSGMTCLDAGCGGGDVTLELARRVGPDGKVLGIDMDATKIEIARAEAAALGVTNVDYRVGRVDEPMDASFDAIYARFLLTHLPDPLHVVQQSMRGCVEEGRLPSRTSISRGPSCTPTPWRFAATARSTAPPPGSAAATRTSARASRCSCGTAPSRVSACPLRSRQGSKGR